MLYNLLQIQEQASQQGNSLVELAALVLGPGGFIAIFIQQVFKAKSDKADKQAQKADSEAARANILERIELSDKKQTEQIAELQCDISVLKNDISEQKELTKAQIDIKKLKSSINNVYEHVVDSDKIHENTIRAIQDGKDKIIQLFSDVITDEFDKDGKSLGLAIESAAKYVKKNCNCTHVELSNIEILTSELKTQVKNFVLEYSILRDNLENGVRRAKFIELCTDFVKRCALLATSNM